MIRILERFFGHQRELLAAAPGKYMKDVWTVTMLESRRFSFKWKPRFLRWTDHGLMEWVDGVWTHPLREEYDDLDIWVGAHISRIEREQEQAYACN